MAAAGMLFFFALVYMMAFEVIPRLMRYWPSQPIRKKRVIIVHHSVSRWGDGDVVIKWHTDSKPRGNGWSKPGYHAVICNGYADDPAWKKREKDKEMDGRVDWIWTESQAVNGCRYASPRALQVCLIGDLDKHEPTEKQMESLVELLAKWCWKYNIDPETGIFGHGEMQRAIGIEGYSKTCPGKKVLMDDLRKRVAEKLTQN